MNLTAAPEFPTKLTAATDAMARESAQVLAMPEGSIDEARDTPETIAAAPKRLDAELGEGLRRFQRRPVGSPPKLDRTCGKVSQELTIATVFPGRDAPAHSFLNTSLGRPVGSGRQAPDGQVPGVVLRQG